MPHFLSEMGVFGHENRKYASKSGKQNHEKILN